MSRLYAFVVVLGFNAGVVAADEAKDVPIGSKIGRFTFKDIRYLPRSLDDFKDKKAFVLVFTNTTCPLVQRYWPTLNEMEKELRAKGVQFLSVNVGEDDSIVKMAAQAVNFGVEFPFVKDFDGKCVAALGVQRTPEVVVLDVERRLRYRGRIDDQYRLGGTRKEPTRNDLREAINDVLAGRDVQMKETPVDGCQITRLETKAPAHPITYADHVGPIVQKHCVQCHRPGTAAPFSLLTYQQVASKGNMIAEVVTEQRMPPWYASPEHGEFINRRGLTAAEREAVAGWVRGGKQLGDERKLPRPPAELEKANPWRIGEPDLVLKTSEHALPASGDIPYKYTVLLYVFTEDTWLQGVQIRPTNPKVLHHCNMAFVTAGEGFKASNFVTGTVPGGEPMTLDSGIAFRIPKGAALGLQIHYVSTGQEEKCQIEVGLKYASGLIQKQLKHKLLVDYRFAIPPGAPAHPVSGSKTLECDAEVLGLFVHMHVRGRDMTFKAHPPEGKPETMLVVPNYNFDWQMPYRYEPGTKRLLKGTRLEAIAHYDNSAFNPYNPDPKATVRDGQQTYQEMMNGFVFYTDATEKLNLEIDGKTGRVKDGKR